jgi:hypothetical protein
MASMQGRKPVGGPRRSPEVSQGKIPKPSTGPAEREKLEVSHDAAEKVHSPL